LKDIKFITAPNPQVVVSPDDNDIRFFNGEPIMVEGKERKFQDIAKILLTRIGSDPVFQTYGSTIPNIIGNRAIDVEPLVSDGVIQAMAFLVEVEESQRADENIASIRSLKVAQNASDSRQLNVSLDVALQTGEVVQSSMRI
jgi:phage baseplate assembly protein W